MGNNKYHEEPIGCEPSKNCMCIVDPVVLAVIFFIYYLVTHPLPDLQKARDYFSDILGTRKFRFIPRSELDVPKITHITEEMDINPYSFFPSKDLM
ncbi:hypothetical protein BBBOND_0309210 [Babesia bigemina]|uniref:Uncharacterized protein n=1 Tax=Babesia bigemina TaxID=5866 RepID=A0A061D8Z2_BABBI|nr:hypothetical protein BBBOND_0309210 [Babesia bigemina]CDR97018.1 hypothetical protein BBBOND_0309210 [Babesia bigemina]|eukprot:XP_012769204.1 hypothetical protein BBBOND_0309210 [Babesia bigemina]